MDASDFVHLHVHSEYSLLDGFSRIEKLAKVAKAQGQTALALTDHGVLYGAMEFYNAVKKTDLKPIIGCETYVSPNKRTDKNGKQDSSAFHLVLLARNELGYRNLCQLVTKAHLEGFYYKPRVDHELLEQYHEGLICLSACAQGEVAQALLKDQYEEAKRTALWYREVFGPENYYLEIQEHGIPELEPLTPAILRLSKETGIPLIATNDAHYVEQKDAFGQDLLLCIQTKTTLNDKNRMKMFGDSFYLKSSADMLQMFPNDVYPRALLNTRQVAEMCDLKFNFDRILLPEFPIPDGHTPDSYLEQLAYSGLERRYNKVTPDLKQRVAYELDIINKCGFALYILIVWDFMREARERGIFATPRGSALASVVCYCIGIHDVEPISARLVFERFLNLERREMPDIDMDFADDRRGEMIEYTINKYGKTRVAQIITFGTLGAKAAIRDVGRAMDLPMELSDRVARLIPQLPVGMTIDKSFDPNENKQGTAGQLKELYENDPLTHELIDNAKLVEGLARHHGVHAAGIVIARDPLVETVPLQIVSRDKIGGTKGEKEDVLVAQYDMNILQKIGLLKMDFLGLVNLSILAKAVALIEQRHGHKLDLTTIPDNDEKVWDMLGKGFTTGVFQLEGVVMTRHIKNLKPTNINDLSAMIALYRPGPADFIPQFIGGKRGTEDVTYPHDDLRPILEDTYGVIVFQEQVLQIVQVIAGYTLGEADILRRAMSKKVAALMDAEKPKFIEGSLKNGYTKELANTLWDIIAKFSGYAFNRAHTAGYGVLSYQTAWLKTNYPVEYMCAVLSCNRGTPEKILLALAECRRLGIAVLPPHINESEVDFSVSDDTNYPNGAIRFGLSAIRNVGQSAAESIVEVRKAGGPFTCLDDLCNRIDPQVTNKRVLESLIKVGGFDHWGHRGQLLAVADRIVGLVQQTRRAAAQGQFSLFDMMGSEQAQHISLPTLPDVPLKEKLGWEKEMIGIYVSEHPLTAALTDLQQRRVLANCAELAEETESAKVTIAGMVVNPRRMTTKKGESMLSATIEDMSGSIDVIVFPRTYATTSEIWAEEKILVIDGKVSVRNDRRQIVCDSALEYTPGDPDDDYDLPLPPIKSPVSLASVASTLKQDIGVDGEESQELAPVTPRPSHVSPVTARVVEQRAYEPPPAYSSSVIVSEPAPAARPVVMEVPPRPPVAPKVPVRNDEPVPIKDSLRLRKYQVVVSISRSDNYQGDVYLLDELVNLLKRGKEGPDRLEVQILIGNQRVYMEWEPGVKVTPRFRDQLCDLLGHEAVHVEEITVAS